MSATAGYLLLRAFCQELARCGVRHACTSPGSRCAPIVLSLVREPKITCWSHIDERCAGFFALGAAKQEARPAAVACTSGTAAANLAPAVIEAHHARIPMIVLTADRPPELREVGAGQAIDQLKLYGDAVKWFFEVGTHEADEERLRWIRALACRAYWTAATGPPGPVHLNFPLREPLVLDEPLPNDPVPARADGRPWVSFAAPREQDGAPIEAAPKTVLVAGAGAPPQLPEVAAAHQLPLLADPLSGARRGPAAIAHYDLLLRDERFVAEHEPQQVIRLGDLPTSKPLRTWLASLRAEQSAIDPELGWQDPAGVLSTFSSTFALTPAAPVPGAVAEQAWLASWRAADELSEQTLEYALGEELSEPLVARCLNQWLPPEATLFTASSMPIRDLESFAGVREAPPRALSNRGANGIDGTVSSAFGAAATGSGPVVLLIGDVALLHDVGGLLAHRRLGLPVTIVLLNNDGGGIFHFLPIASERDAFETHVATPHGFDFAGLAQNYGFGYERPRDRTALADALQRSIASDGAELIEVRTDRLKNASLHRRASAAVGDALSR